MKEALGATLPSARSCQHALSCLSGSSVISPSQGCSLWNFSVGIHYRQTQGKASSLSPEAAKAPEGLPQGLKLRLKAP